VCTKQDYSTKITNLHSKLREKSSFWVIDMIKKLGTQVIFILALSKYQITTLPFSPRAGKLGLKKLSRIIISIRLVEHVGRRWKEGRWRMRRIGFTVAQIRHIHALAPLVIILHEIQVSFLGRILNVCMV